MMKVRCAIYTRKSSEEGLEQAFNSLDAQREACAAYILSQASEGWSLIPDIYDDGGLSGGTLQRPALQRLLSDVADDRIDIIVVYKVDRLTRSLLDFSKLVEAFDKANTSFVSVTQSFNTTTSMGRLTLNMLLSFAQFEREVTAERIRDKIAASKAKGMWMGGTPPLGYRPDGRSLAIVEDHAAVVRLVFERYLQVGTVAALLDHLRAEKVNVPARATGGGRLFGGRPFARGQLHFLLRNPIYVGEIRHRDRTYPGTHPAIIDRATWGAVQAMLDANTQGDTRAPRRTKPSLLAGLVVDETGEPLVVNHACKGNVRYRYYVSRQLKGSGGSASPNVRIPAREIEAAVLDVVATGFQDPLQLASAANLAISTADIASIISVGAATAAALRAGDHYLLQSMISDVQVLPDRLLFNVLVAEVAAVFGLPCATPTATIPLSAALRVTRTGHTVRLVLPGGQSAVVAPPNMALIKLVLTSRRWWARIAVGDIDVTELAREEGVSRSYVCRTLRSAFLAPSIVDAIVTGSQPAALEARKLKEPGAMPHSWEEQRRRFGAGERERA